MKRGAFVAFIATMVFTGVMQPVVAAPAHYFVVSENAAGELSIVSHRIVDIDGIEQSSLPHPAYSLFEQTLTIEVVSKRSNAVAFKSATTASPWIRGEFHDSPHQSGVGHNIKGHIVPEQERTYVVRVPSTSDQVLKLRKLVPVKGGISSAALGAGALDIDLDRIERSAVAPSALPAGYDAGTVLDNGPLSNRLDLLIMGDGYTAAQRETFVADATNLANAFLNVSPYRDFKQLINVHWLFVPSNQSGADKPACTETPGSAVIAVDTAFDATFCASGIRRLVTVNGTKVVNAAAAIPGWDAIMVIVNDTEYGGSGGTRSVITKAAAAVEIAQHEFGHSFSRLADEYTTAFPSFPACSDVTGTTACQSNVTDQTDRALVKWNAWIANTTPVPTTDPVAGDNRAAGLWEGARYLEQDMYRQCFNGAMRSLGAPFCKVDSEAFVKRLYAPTGAGWGVPSAGVSLIEPTSTPLGPTFAAQPNRPMTFRARVAGSTNPLTVEWRVDGMLVQSGTALHGEDVAFIRNAPGNGAVAVELKVFDSTVVSQRFS